MASKLKQYTDEEYKKLEADFDKRYKFFKLLREFYEKHGTVPEKYQKDWEDFQVKDAGLLWNEQKHAVRTLKKVAKIHAKRRIRNEKNNKK